MQYLLIMQVIQSQTDLREIVHYLRFREMLALCEFYLVVHVAALAVDHHDI